MSLIFSTFSQSLNNPLPEIKAEYDGLLEIYNDVQNKVSFQPYHGKTAKELVDLILEKQDSLKVFHFSGHSNQEGLGSDQEKFEGASFARLINSINVKETKLECVFLNGCSNSEIVQLLNNIPIVIGSKSPILDKDAIQFTRNFFNALLKGNASYEEAFNQAHENLDNTDVKAIKLTRGGGDMQEELNQNDYFISINQEEFAGQKFPFKRKQTSIWLKAIPILLTIFIGTWFVITFKKIECPKWVDYQKCNILVSNFNDLSGKNRNVNRLISESLSMNKVLEPYIEAINKKSLEEIFINSAQEVSKLFSKCKCDYYISGNLEDIENASIIQMNLLPLEQGQFSTEKHTFGILLDFGEMIQTIDPEKDSGSSIITQICLACAKNNTNSNNKQLLQIAENQNEQIKNKKYAQEIYQNNNIQLAEAHLERKDTNKAVQMLAKASSIDINDKALVALEKQDQLLMASKNYEAAKKVKQDYIIALDKRINEVKGINFRCSLDKYQIAKNDIQIAIKDLPIAIKPSIDSSISQVPKWPASNTTPLITEYIILAPQNSNGKPIGLYKVKIPNQRTTVTRNRTFKIPCNNWQCIGEKITISAEGYLPKKIILSKSDRPIKVKLEKMVTPN